MTRYMSLDMDVLRNLSSQDAASCIAAFVEALVQVNMLYLSRTSSVPKLHTSGVRYNENECWRDIPALLRTGEGDCKSLCAWRIAELRAHDKSALVHVVYLGNTRSTDEDLFHVQVRRGGVIEDPSRFLGMRP